MSVFLSAHGVGVQRGGRWTLRNVSLSIDAGSVLGLVGPNGSGKSTLLRCLAGLWTATEGSVELQGIPLTQLKRNAVARRVTYVPQDTVMEFEFTVREAVAMGRYPHRGRFERETEEDRQATAAALDRADITVLGDRSVTQLSGGERQRVLIARSLATRAGVLLLDEPTANLDVDHGLDVLELCRSLADDGHAVVIATHDLNAVWRYADRVALLDAGRITAIGNPEAVLTPQNVQQTFRVQSEMLVASDGSRQLLFNRLTDSRNDRNKESHETSD
jgi:iron complex transport system ATP-binding protein